MVLSHVVLHVTLCNSAMRLKLQTPMSIHITATDRANRTIADQSFTVVRENGGVANVSWDQPWGMYRLETRLRGPSTNCGDTTYFAVVNGHDRNLAITVHEREQPPLMPTLVFGASPFSYSYAQPTVVVFDSKTVKCDAQVPDPVESDFTQNDSDGYYAAIFPSPLLVQHQPLVLALRITDSRSNYHYVRLGKQQLSFGEGPNGGSRDVAYSMDVSEDTMDYITRNPEDTLLCPTLHSTRTSF